MAESKLQSKKRTRSSSSAVAASCGHPILTRSKSQIYLHCHRSGRARADSLRFSKLNSSLRSAPVAFTSKSKRPRLGRIGGDGDADGDADGNRDGVDSQATDDWSCNIQIKDLRTRRVLSLPSAAPGEGNLRVVGDDGEQKVEGSKKGRDQILEVEAVGSDSFVDKIQNFFGEAGVLENRGDESHNLNEVQRDEKKSWGDGEIPNGVGDLVEECMQATPPDAEILDRVYGGRDENAAFVPKQKPFVGSDEQSQDLHDIVDRNQKVVRRRSRVKIFKSPGSLSYKRLLPYLMDVGKDDSCVLEKDCANMKSEKVMTNKSISDGLNKNVHSDDSKTLITGAPILVNASFRDNHCSKPVVNQGDKDVGNLYSGRSSSMGCYPLDKHSNDSGQAEEADSEGVDAQHLNDTRHISPLTLEKYQPGNDDESCQHSGHTTETPTEGHIKVSQPCKAIKPNIFNANLHDSEVNRGNCVSEKKSDNYDAAGLLPTPSDTDMCVKPEAQETASNGNKRATESHQVLGKPLNVDTYMTDSHISFNRPRSSSGRKPGLSPCSQMKLFKTPSSFSYKRLLPYLMDITKNNYVEESSEPNPPSKFSTSGLHSSPSENLNRQNFHMDDEGKDSHSLRMAISTSTNIASEVQPSSSTCPEHNSGIPESFGSQEPHRFQVVKGTTEKDGRLKPTLGAGTPIDGRNSLTGDSSILCSTSQTEVFDPLKVSRRGILKRNPRGCRGSCTCLNCASFRLHAERAFEFSKNQMEDAEEVAQDLVKELSHLRKLFVTFASNSDDSASFSIDQVNEACKKAAEAEELAKNRLVQMKDDLNIHCRITCGQRPKVTFANEVDERIISER